MKTTIKRHLISFLVTFSAMFLLFLYPAIISGNFKTSVIVAAVLAAVRSAFKSAWELFLVPLLNILVEWSKNNIKIK